MNTPTAVEPAELWRRAAARAIDALVMAVIAALTTVAAGLTSLLITQPDFFSEEGWDAHYRLLVILLIPASIPVVRYEMVSTARRGQTFAKKLLGIRVVRWDDQDTLTSEQIDLQAFRCLVRWVIPHVIGVSVAVGAGVASVPRIGGLGVLAGAGAGLWAMMLVYLSSVLDENGRGWHDKAAGTIVVMARDAHMEQ